MQMSTLVYYLKGVIGRMNLPDLSVLPLFEDVQGFMSCLTIIAEEDVRLRLHHIWCFSSDWKGTAFNSRQCSSAQGIATLNIISMVGDVQDE